MNAKTPPGFYFVLLLAVLAFVYGAGLTRLPSDGAEQTCTPAVGGHGRIGVYLTAFALTKPSVMEAVYTAKEAGQIDTLVINVKNMHGEITYASQIAQAQEIGASTGRLEISAWLSELRARGFYLVARQVVFYDPLLARHLGLDDAWVPGDHPVAREYNLAVAEEVAALGFDELQLDYIRYADVGALEPIYEPRYEAITGFVAEVRHRLPAGVSLSADLFGRVLWPWNTRRVDPIGQSLEDLAPYLDHISPMVYPSHYHEQLYRDDPYRTVQDAMHSGTERVDTSLRPFLQAFDRHLPEGMSLESYIAEQIKAAQAHGADGFLFWHPACDYGPLFRVLEPSVP
jgi:hypothetical protein